MSGETIEKIFGIKALKTGECVDAHDVNIYDGKQADGNICKVNDNTIAFKPAPPKQEVKEE